MAVSDERETPVEAANADRDAHCVQAFPIKSIYFPSASLIHGQEKPTALSTEIVVGMRLEAPHSALLAKILLQSTPHRKCPL